MHLQFTRWTLQQLFRRLALIISSLLLRCQHFQLLLFEDTSTSTHLHHITCTALCSVHMNTCIIILLDVSLIFLNICTLLCSMSVIMNFTFLSITFTFTHYVDTFQRHPAWLPFHQSNDINSISSFILNIYR